MLKTHITLVVDSSGSMSSIQEESQNAVNALIEEQKTIDSPCSFIMYEFEGDVRKLYEGPIVNAPEYTLKPGGMTALVDAIGTAINRTGEKLRNMTQSKRPEKVMFMVMTDGHENVSREFSMKQIAEMIKHQETKYQWEFIYMASGLNPEIQATMLGFGAHTHVIATSNSGHSHTMAYNGVSTLMAASRSGQSVSYAANYDADGNLV